MYICWVEDVAFPPLRLLRTVRCEYCKAVKGIGSLPALTALNLERSCVDAHDEWSASLRDVSIICHDAYNPHLLARLADMQHLTHLYTDWSFARGGDLLTNAHLSFLPNLPLQRLNVYVNRMHPLFNHLGAIEHLRDLELNGGDITDQDVACLAQLTNLQDLSLLFTAALTCETLHVVCALPHLTQLSLHVCDGINDYSEVAKCVQLRSLQRTGVNRRIQAISMLGGLEKLILQASGGFVDTDSCFSHMCREMRGLRELSFTDCINMKHSGISVAAFSELSCLSLMEHLSVCPIKEDDISKLVDCLVQLPKLREIVCSCSCVGCSCVGRESMSDSEDYVDDDDESVCEQDENLCGTEDMQRLRNALPRLERADFYSLSGYCVV